MNTPTPPGRRVARPRAKTSRRTGKPARTEHPNSTQDAAPPPEQQTAAPSAAEEPEQTVMPPAAAPATEARAPQTPEPAPMPEPPAEAVAPNPPKAEPKTPQGEASLPIEESAKSNPAAEPSAAAEPPNGEAPADQTPAQDRFPRRGRDRRFGRDRNSRGRDTRENALEISAAPTPAPRAPQPPRQDMPRPISPQAREGRVGNASEMGPKPRGLTVLGSKTTVYSDHYTPAILEAFDNRHPGADTFVKFNCPEFTSLCPITGQPDFATLYISYIPDRKMVESKSLKLYLFSFRNHGAFHEDCVNIILEDLIRLLAPRYIEIWGKFLPRGGLSIDPYVNYGRPSTRWEEFARQRMLMHDLSPERIDNR